jgi:hypothetical protein
LRWNPSFLGSGAARERYGGGQNDGKLLKEHDLRPGSHFVMTKLVPAIHGLKERRGCPAENRA